MKVGFVVLYVEDSERCRAFWIDQVGMVERGRDEVAGFVIPQVGFADQDFRLQLVPKAMMQDNPDGLGLAAPSMAFHVADLAAERARLVAAGVAATEVSDHHGMSNFAFPDPEGRWFAVIAAP
jgi:lactoylglutathione lyase